MQSQSPEKEKEWWISPARSGGWAVTFLPSALELLWSLMGQGQGQAQFTHKEEGAASLEPSSRSRSHDKNASFHPGPKTLEERSRRRFRLRRSFRLLRSSGVDGRCRNPSATAQVSSHPFSSSSPFRPLSSSPQHHCAVFHGGDAPCYATWSGADASSCKTVAVPCTFLACGLAGCCCLYKFVLSEKSCLFLCIRIRTKFCLVISPSCMYFFYFYFSI